MIIIHTDALVEPVNPNGIATYGYTIYDEETKTKIEQRGFIGKGRGMSNNYAEFEAVRLALSGVISRFGTDQLTILFTDSQLVANILPNYWRIKGGDYQKSATQASLVYYFFSNIQTHWIPREQNEEADRLARKAYKEYCHANHLRYKFSPHTRNRNRRNKRKHKYTPHKG